MRISELMTRNVATVDTRSTLADAAKLMWIRDCGVLPVVDADTGKLCGMITDRDITMGTMTQNRAPATIPVTMSMSKSPITCRPEASAEEAFETLGKYQIRRLPVLDKDDKLVGIVSINDLARRAVSTDSHHAKDAVRSRLAKTLAAICKPNVVAQAAEV